MFRKLIQEMSNKTKNIFASIIIALGVALAVTSSWNDSLIIDEIPHVGAGYSYLVKQDMRLNPEHPPLAKDLAAIPLLFLNLKQDAFQTKFWQSDLNGQWEFGRRLIFNSDNNAGLITHLVHFPILIFFVLSAILIFKWGLELYGGRAAFLALILFIFSPTVLAHSRFVTTDLAALFGALYGTYFFIRYLKNSTRKNLWLAGLIFGVALLTKFSTFLLVLFLPVVALVWELRKESHFFSNLLAALKKSVLVFLIGFVVIIWPVYLFHTWNYPPERQHSDAQQNLATYGRRYVADPIVWASDKPVIRAAAQYGVGLLMVTQRSVGGNTTYFLGEVSRFGWRYYFPVIYLIKEPLAWWALAVMAIIGIFVKAKKEDRKTQNENSKLKKLKNWLKKYFVEFSMLLWLAVYWFASIKSTLNIGVRHLLPIYPFAILLVSGQLARFFENLKLKTENYKTEIKIVITLILILLGWYIFENLSVYPYYLTYFNQTVGGSSGGYKYVVDSNLDWGQDLKRFSQWVKESNIPKVEFDYFGWADPYYYLGQKYIWTSSAKYKDAEDFKLRNQSDGWLAVSATFLQGSQGSPDEYKSPNYLWLQSYTPLTVIGHSIFVYRIK